MAETARIHIMGCAAVVVSTIALEDWRLAEQYAPEALWITDENNETVFEVTTSPDSPGHITKDSVCWSPVTEDGKATITVLIDPEIEDRNEAVMRTAGSAMLDLIEIEKKMPQILEEVRKRQRKWGELIVLVWPEEGSPEGENGTQNE